MECFFWGQPLRVVYMLGNLSDSERPAIVRSASLLSGPGRPSTMIAVMV
jgi:hypothetical protein